MVMRLFKFNVTNASTIRTIMVANCLNEDTVTAHAEKTDDGGATAANSFVNLPVIGEQLPQPEDDDVMLDCTETESCCIEEPIVVQQKQKSVQSLQMFENGEYVTKYLEVDSETDMPSNKLNGTIEYSSDYRLAEKPKSLMLQSTSDYTSSSEQSTNGNNSGSDTSEKSGNSLSADTFEPSQKSYQSRASMYYLNLSSILSYVIPYKDFFTPSNCCHFLID